MRCKNCGWPNKPNVTNCVKCNSPLISDSVNDFNSSEPSIQLNKTVREGDIFGGAPATNTPPPYYGTEPPRAEQQRPQPQPQPQTSNCPKCGYPLRPGSDKCPNCKFQIAAPTQEEPSYRRERELPKDEYGERHRTRMSSGNEQANNKMRGTINPYMMNLEAEPTFVLRPIKKVGERHDFDDQEYEGKEVVLSRDNTDPDNASITSRRQATITNTEGHWYIEDNSDQKTTFVQAAQKIELHDGDIILLGNRLFEFHK